MIEEAESKGANAVIAMRFDASEIGNGWAEICAYGTAESHQDLAVGHVRTATSGVRHRTCPTRPLESPNHALPGAVGVFSVMSARAMSGVRHRTWARSRHVQSAPRMARNSPVEPDDEVGGLDERGRRLDPKRPRRAPPGRARRALRKRRGRSCRRPPRARVAGRAPRASAAPPSPCSRRPAGGLPAPFARTARRGLRRAPSPRSGRARESLRPRRRGRGSGTPRRALRLDSARRPRRVGRERRERRPQRSADGSASSPCEPDAHDAVDTDPRAGRLARAPAHDRDERVPRREPSELGARLRRRGCVLASRDDRREHAVETEEEPVPPAPRPAAGGARPSSRPRRETAGRTGDPTSTACRCLVVDEAVAAAAEELPLEPAAKRRAGHGVDEEADGDPDDEEEAGAGAALRLLLLLLRLDAARGAADLRDDVAQLGLDVLVADELRRRRG